MLPVGTPARPQGVIGQRYRLLHRIGADGPTETWEAYDARLDRPVAVRLLAQHAQRDEAARAGLRQALREALLTTTPGAPRVLDGGEDQSYGPFVVIELNDAFEPTQLIPIVSPSADARPRGTTGLLALLAVAALIIAALVVLVRAATPGDDQTPVAPVVVPGAPAPTPAAEATRAPTRQPTPPPTARQTPQPQPAGVASALETIHQHYMFINARQYDDGYALMDAHLRSVNSPADYAGWFANKISIEPISAEVTSQSDDQVVVRSVVRSTDRVNGQNVTLQVSEEFVLRMEDGAWRIARVTRS